MLKSVFNAVGIFTGIASGSVLFFQMLDPRLEKIKKDFNEEIKTQREELISRFKEEIQFEKSKIKADFATLKLEIDTQKKDVFDKVTEKENEIANKIAELIRYAKPINIKKHLLFEKKTGENVKEESS